VEKSIYGVAATNMACRPGVLKTTVATYDGHMLGRYTMYRGKRPEDDPRPEGKRQDSRKHTNHCLRPTKEMVTRYQEDRAHYPWGQFEKDYLVTLDQRFHEDSTPFDDLASLARKTDVYIGCSCPTKKNPNVHNCHTVLALRFMHKHYPDLEIEVPARK